LTSLTDGIVVRDVGRRFDSKESREEVEVDLLDGSCDLNESVNDGVGAAFLHGPSDEREGEEVKGVWPAKAQSALAPTVSGEVDAGGAPNDEHQGVLGELSAQGPESGSVIAEEVPNVVPSTSAWRDPALRCLVLPVPSSGCGEGRRELDEPRTVDGVEKVVLGEMFDERMISSAETVKERQEDNMSLGHLLRRGAMT
jgi:hypothetical protein